MKLALRHRQHDDRAEARRRARRWFALDLPLVGRSRVIRALTRQLACSPRSWPLLLTSAEGSCSLAWMVALHVAASEERRPLRVEPADRLPAGPRSFVDRLRRWTEAGEGTLALLQLERLSAVQLEMLPEALDGSPPVLATVQWNAGISLAEARRYGGFASYLSLPPLRERPEDVEPLLLYFLDRHGFPEPLRLSDEVLRLCLGYGWPGNEEEISRLAARLSAICGSGTVGLEQLARVAPELTRGTDAESSFEALRDDAPDHPALRRALFFMRDNFRRSLRLEEVAQAAYVSPGHLAHLFRSQMDLTFLELLTRLRLERACTLLGSREWTLPRVAQEAGFSSLRQMERGFRRYLGTSPSSHRRKIRRRHPQF